VLALPTAYALAKIPFRAKRAVELFILAPLIVPGLIVGVGIGFLFFRVGLAYTIVGVILAQTIGTLPFMIRVLSATLEAVPADLVHAARTLGASPLRVGWHILVPLAWPGFVAGGLLSFVASFEEFEKTFIVGAPLVETLTVKLWATLGGKVMIFPAAAVVTFIVLVPTVIIFFLAERAMRNDGALAAGMGKL
jgi:multiple sugar transport system permease protein/putative spermidine/putrescine transport system permease protein